jgi:hypothetical protein
MCIFQFSKHGCDHFSVALLDKINEAATDDQSRDRFFVGELLTAVFTTDILGTHTLGGSQIQNEVTGRIEVGNKLDTNLLNLIYDVYCTRVTAVGINKEERSLRMQRKVFNDFVKMEADKHKKRRLRQELQERQDS